HFVACVSLELNGEVRTDASLGVRAVADRAVRFEEGGSVDGLRRGERLLDALQERDDRIDLAAVQRTAEGESPGRHRRSRTPTVDRVVDDLRDVVGVSAALRVPVVDELQRRLGVLA